jgi:hypothetical protein
MKGCVPGVFRLPHASDIRDMQMTATSTSDIATMLSTLS